MTGLGIVIAVILVAIIVIVWLVLRDPTGTPPSGRHRSNRDPQDLPLIDEDDTEED